MRFSNKTINLFEEYKEGYYYNFNKEDFKKILLNIKNNKIKKKLCCYFIWLKDTRNHILETYFNDFKDIKEWDIEFKQKYYISKGLSIDNIKKSGKPRIVSLVTSKAGILWKELDQSEKNKYIELSKNQKINNTIINEYPLEETVKRKRGRPKKIQNTLEISDASINDYNNKNNISNIKEKKIEVEILTYNETEYFLDSNTGDIYDTDVDKPTLVGKKTGENIYIN